MRQWNFSKKINDAIRAGLDTFEFSNHAVLVPDGPAASAMQPARNKKPPRAGQVRLLGACSRWRRYRRQMRTLD
jgi:uncharacterized protein YjiS (DUF1127 family)